MSLKKAVLMLALVIVGAAYAWRFERSAPSGDGGDDEPKPVIESFDRMSVDGIVLAPKDGDSIELLGGPLEPIPETDRQDRHWELAEPAGATADDDSVATLLYAVDSLQSHHTLPLTEETKEQFGLDAPELVVSLFQGDAETKLSFGRKHPFSGRRYLRVGSSDQVLMVDESSYRLFEKKPIDLRDKTPLNFSPEDVSEIQVESLIHPPYRLRREADDEWSVIVGENSPRKADAEMIGRLLGVLHDAQVEEFIDSPEEDSTIYGLRRPQVAVDLTFAAADPLRFIAGEVAERDGEKARYYFALNPAERVFRAKEPFFSGLVQPAHYFLDKTPFDELPLERVQSVTLRRLDERGETFSFVRIKNPKAGEVWAITNDLDINDIPDQKKTEEWLSELFGLRVLSFARPGEKDSDSVRPVATIDIVYQESEENFPSYHLTIAGPLTESATGGDDSGSVPPRFGTIRDTGGVDVLPVVLSGGTWRALDRHISDFLVTPDDATGESANGNDS
ncbi:MAG: DUF4340 domain-containing protein [Bdellovibrionales bacterium]|nr:DUF4340 domain-containing protein [Bdellovibrionales bacterium]